LANKIANLANQSALNTLTTEFLEGTAPAHEAKYVRISLRQLAWVIRRIFGASFQKT
jgi:hypothetical protein